METDSKRNAAPQRAEETGKVCGLSFSGAYRRRRGIATQRAGHGLSLCVLCVLCGLFLTGCVSAHKKGRTIHERFDYQVCRTAPGCYEALLTCHEIWRDEWRGGGRAFLADPKASELVSNHTNQLALGGSSSLQIGSIESTVSTNAVKILSDAVSQTASEVISKLIAPKP